MIQMKRSAYTNYIPLLLLVFMVVPPSLFAQTSNEISTNELRDLGEGKRVPAFQAIETEGTPYLLDEFQKGSVLLRNGRTTETLTMNFNIHQNRVEYLDGDIVYAVNSDMIRGFTINDTDVQYKFGKGYSARGLNPDELVRILADGKATVLVKHEVGFQRNVATYGTATQKDAYVSRDILYIIKDGDIERIRRIRERSILRSFGTYQKEMQNFAEENNLDLTSLEDIKTLFEYYNNL